MKKIISISILFLILVTGTANSSDPKFLFTQDQDLQFKREKLMKDIKNTSNLSKDKWFNAPATRIELMTYFLYQDFKDYFDIFWNAKADSQNYSYFGLLNYFGRRKDLSPVFNEPSGEFNVIYDKDHDLFVFTISVSQLGKPKKPMKEACD